MIEWGRPTMTWQESVSPRGYTVAVVPAHNKCHVVATYDGPEGPPSIGEIRDIPFGVYDTSRAAVESRRAATRELKAKCEEHATRVRAASEGPPPSA